MQVKTKYNIGDIVYVFDENKIKHITIFEIKIIVNCGWWGKEIHNESAKLETHIYYHGFTRFERMDKNIVHKWYNENKIFKTKKDIDEYLKKYFKSIIDEVVE